MTHPISYHLSVESKKTNKQKAELIEAVSNGGCQGMGDRGERNRVAKGHKLSGRTEIRSGDLCVIVTIVGKVIKLFKFAKRVELQCSHLKNKDKYVR